jgi:hypothetical protein
MFHAPPFDFGDRRINIPPRENLRQQIYATEKTMMSEREPDDIPKPAPPPQDRRERAPGDYYYDDATGYEIYKPEDEDESEPDEPHTTALRRDV